MNILVSCGCELNSFEFWTVGCTKQCYHRLWKLVLEVYTTFYKSVIYKMLINSKKEKKNRWLVIVSFLYFVFIFDSMMVTFSYFYFLVL